MTEKSGGPAAITSPAAPISVLHLFGTLLPGGAERQALALVRRGDPARVRFSAINCCAAENLLGAEFAATGCPTTVLDKFSMRALPFVWRLSRLIRDRRPDIVHTWLYAPGFWGRAAAILAGAPAIIASTRTAKRYTRRHERFLDRLLSRRTCVRIVNSNQIRQMLIDDVHVDARSIEVIPNGVDPERFQPSADRETLRARFGWKPDEITLLAVGRLVPAKNYPMLFRVMRRLRETHPRFRAVIAGWGDLESGLREQCDSMDLADRIKFLGPREDAADLMAAADIYLMTSAWEGFPNALLEAMWSGLPVVSTRVSGAEELIDHNVTGLLVDVDDDRAMAENIAALVGDAPRRERLATAGRSLARDRFTIDRMVEAHLAVYERVFAATRRKGGAA